MNGTQDQIQEYIARQRQRQAERILESAQRAKEDKEKAAKLKKDWSLNKDRQRAKRASRRKMQRQSARKNRRG